MKGRMTRRQLLVRASRHRAVRHRRRPAPGRVRRRRHDEPGLASASGTPKAGGTLKVAMVSPIVALEPTTMYDTGSIAICQQVAEYLVWVNNDLTLRPVLAEKWDARAQTARPGRSTCARA